MLSGQAARTLSQTKGRHAVFPQPLLPRPDTRVGPWRPPQTAQTLGSNLSPPPQHPRFRASRPCAPSLLAPDPALPGPFDPRPPLDPDPDPALPGPSTPAPFLPTPPVRPLDPALPGRLDPGLPPDPVTLTPRPPAALTLRRGRRQEQ